MQWVQDVFPPKRRQRLLQNHNLDGGFKCFYLHPYFGGDVQFDEHHLFQMGGVVQNTTNQ